MSLGTVLHLLGLRWDGLLLPAALVAALFLGPALQGLLDGTWPRAPRWDNPATIRNLVAAPLTEELCVRCGLVSYLLARGVSPPRCLWLSPSLFGLAHLHHAVDLVKHQRWTVGRAAVVCAVQFGYTLVFGWFAVFLLLRTGHAAAPVAAHAVCNYMGFPRFSAIAEHPRHARVVVIAYLAGIAAFAALLFPLTSPAVFFAPWQGGAGKDYIYPYANTFI